MSLNPEPPRPIDGHVIVQPQWEQPAHGSSSPSSSSAVPMMGVPVIGAPNDPHRPEEWTRAQDDRLRFLRAHLEQHNELPPCCTQQEFLELERHSAIFEREGMMRLMAGITPEQQASSPSSSPTTAAAAASSSAHGEPEPSSFSKMWESASDAVSSAGDYLGRKLPEITEKSKITKAGWFYTSLIATGAPALGKRLGLVDEKRYRPYNWISDNDSSTRTGGLVLTSVPIIAPESMGGQLEELRADCKARGATLGAYVACLGDDEMDGFGLHAIQFAKPADWTRVFQSATPSFEVISAPMVDCTASGMSYDKLMLILERINDNICAGRSVAIGCKAGKGRSWLVMACYLIAYRGMTPSAATELIKSKRHQVSPSTAQVDFVSNLFYRNFMLLEHTRRAERERLERLRTAGVHLGEHEQYGFIHSSSSPSSSPLGQQNNVANKNNNDDDDDDDQGDNARDDHDAPPPVEEEAPAAVPDNKTAAAMDQLFGDDAK